MATKQLGARFKRWVDSALGEPIPAGVVAFNFNLYESPFRAELVGATQYDPDDSDWACEEAFVPRERVFDFPKSGIPARWTDKLQLAKTLLVTYLRDSSNAGDRLRAAKAVTVGFVDGDLHRVWPVAKRRKRAANKR